MKKGRYKRMLFLKKRMLLIASMLLVALVAAACGSSTGSSSSYTSTGNTTASTNSSTSTPASTKSSSSTATIQTAKATINGKSETILTNSKGLTLYYRTSDTASSVCNGACAQVWPPLLSTGAGTPTSATSLPGKFSVNTNANGSQVAYNGHLLYTYASDTAPGQINGQGIQGIWFVVPTSLASGSGSSGNGGGSYKAPGY